MLWPDGSLWSEKMNLKRTIHENTMSYYEGNRCVFSIEEEEKDSIIQICLQGELRSELVHDFQDELVALATVGASILLNFGDLKYLSPSAQEALVRVQQKMDTLGVGELVLQHLPEEIYHEFEKTGAIELLMIQN